MINITSLESDVLGALTLQEDPAETNFGVDKRGQNRVPTLDCSSVLQDRGYSVSDLPFKVVVKNYETR